VKPKQQVASSGLGSGPLPITITDRPEDELMGAGNASEHLGRVECISSPLKMLFLGTSSRVVDRSFVNKHLKLKTRGRVLQFKVPGVAASPRTLNCFAENDLVISSDGIISITDVRTASIISVDEPPRLVVTVWE